MSQRTAEADQTPLFDDTEANKQGVDLHADDPLPDIPDAGDDSVPITSPDPLDFSTKNVTTAGAAGMSTFNDGDDQSLFERTVDVFEQSGASSPMLGDALRGPRRPGARIYGAHNLG